MNSEVVVRGSSEVVPLDDEQRVLDVVTSSVFKLWEAVNSLTRLRPTTRSRYGSLDPHRT